LSSNKSSFRRKPESSFTLQTPKLDPDFRRDDERKSMKKGANGEADQGDGGDAQEPKPDKPEKLPHR
jgi:hypothetical protein